MPFFVSTVQACPVAKGARGIVEIDPDIIGQLAGAVWDDSDEWLIVLLGTKSKNGLHVVVDNYYVPSNQQRSGATCSIEGGLPDHITKNVVGALHSHNKMTAKFSHTDRSSTGLNSTFPLSIVISTNYTAKEVEYTLLGFAYEAEGRFTLPCGSLGVASFTLRPAGMEDWPIQSEIVVPDAHKLVSAKDLRDCDSWEPSEDSTRFMLKRIGNCGLAELEGQVRRSIFGSDGEDILDRLPLPSKFVSMGHTGYGKGDDSYRPMPLQEYIDKMKAEKKALPKLTEASIDDEDGRVVLGAGYDEIFNAVFDGVDDPYFDR